MFRDHECVAEFMTQVWPSGTKDSEFTHSRFSYFYFEFQHPSTSWLDNCRWSGAVWRRKGGQMDSWGGFHELQRSQHEQQHDRNQLGRHQTPQKESEETNQHFEMTEATSF